MFYVEDFNLHVEQSKEQVSLDDLTLSFIWLFGYINKINLYK